MRFVVSLPEGTRVTSMLIATDPALLQRQFLFEGLSERQLAWLAERLHSTTFPAGANIMTAEQPGEVVYFIQRGTVKIHVAQTGGADVVLAILGQGDTVGEMSLIDSAGRSASVLTLEETTAWWMDRETFQAALHDIPGLALNLVRTLAARVRLVNELVQALATLDVYGRVARQLLAFADKYGAEDAPGSTLIPIRLTQGDIADLVGASRKRVNQVMVSFRQLGLISTNAGGQITVHRREELARYCR
jgi:CRP/FNR family cyclic AMP-dependent transcriptional regulator